MGGRRGRYVGGLGTPAKSQIDRPRFAGRRVREYLLEKSPKGRAFVKEEALLAARLLQGAEIELLPTRALFEAATRMSIQDRPSRL